MDSSRISKLLFHHNFITIFFVRALKTDLLNFKDAWLIGCKIWRKRVRVEHTLDTAKVPSAGFEDRENHRIPFASALYF